VNAKRTRKREGKQRGKNIRRGREKARGKEARERRLLTRKLTRVLRFSKERGRRRISWGKRNPISSIGVGREGRRRVKNRRFFSLAS